MKDDWISLVDPPKRGVVPPILALELAGVEFPRVIPYEASALASGTFVDKKVRGKDAIRVFFSVPTVRLRHRGKVWQESSQFSLDLPRKLAIRIAHRLLVYERPGKPRGRKIPGKTPAYHANCAHISHTRRRDLKSTL
jgi:hypothetical protein